jgi:hypothetical protein
MAVSKRLRFEILRRDNHTCRYFGASAPDVPLRVDHVTPEALGGRTEPSNLVTACEPCNSGKSSVALDGAMVEDIKADALRLAELQRQAYEVLAAQVEVKGGYVDRFGEAWRLIGAPLPYNWRATLGRWHDMGVPLSLILDAADVAYGTPRVAEKNLFTYMCGIVWNRVQVVTAESSTRMALDGAWVSSFDEWLRGWSSAEESYQDQIWPSRMLEDFADRFSRPAREWSGKGA